MAYHRDRGVDTRIIRIFNTYGPRMRPDDGRVVTNFIHQALRGEPLTIYGDGSQTRSFQYVDDLVEGIFRLMGVTHHGPVNLGNPEECTIQQFALYIRNLINPELNITYLPMPLDDPKQRRPNIFLAMSIIDWSPKIGIAAGIKKRGCFRM